MSTATGLQALSLLAQSAGIAIAEAKPKMPTYAQAQEAILADLAQRGWTVKAGLKIPHATSKDGRYRLWFKTQAVYYTIVGASSAGLPGAHNFQAARSLWVDDIRKGTPESFYAAVEAGLKRRDGAVEEAISGRGAPSPWKVGYSVVKGDAKGTGSVYGTIVKMTSSKPLRSKIEWEDGTTSVVETGHPSIRAFRGKPPTAAPTAEGREAGDGLVEKLGGGVGAQHPAITLWLKAQGEIEGIPELVDTVVAAADDVVKASESKDVPQRQLRLLGALQDALADLVSQSNRAYAPFAQGRDAMYELAKSWGLSTKRSGGSKPAPKEVGNMTTGALLAELAKGANGLHKGMEDILQTGAAARKALKNALTSANPGNLAALAIEKALDHRDAVSVGLFARVKGVERRAAEILRRVEADAELLGEAKGAKRARCAWEGDAEIPKEVVEARLEERVGNGKGYSWLDSDLSVVVKKSPEGADVMLYSDTFPTADETLRKLALSALAKAVGEHEGAKLAVDKGASAVTFVVKGLQLGEVEVMVDELVPRLRAEFAKAAAKAAKAATPTRSAGSSATL